MANPTNSSGVKKGIRQKCEVKDPAIERMELAIRRLRWIITEKDKIDEYLKWHMEEETDYHKRLVKKMEEMYENYGKKSPEEKAESSLHHMYNLYHIIIGATTLDEFVYTLLELHISTIKSLTMQKIIDAENMPSSSVRNLQFLRIGGIISEKDYKNLHTLYEIRNKFVHISLARLNTQKIFDLMNNVEIDNEKINQMPNTVEKYYEIIIFYSERLNHVLVIYKEKAEQNKVAKEP